MFATRPEVLAHNLETVPRIFKRIRPAFRYQRSLDVITAARDAGLVTKSNLILGMGETPDEVTQALHDLHDAGCDIITITQYLRPSPRHHPVERWVKPEEFVEHSKTAEEIGLRRRHGRARWSARPTAPAGSTRRRWPHHGRELPAGQAHSPRAAMRRRRRVPHGAARPLTHACAVVDPDGSSPRTARDVS